MLVKCPYCKNTVQYIKDRPDYEGLEHCPNCSGNYRVKYEGNYCIYAEKRGIEMEIPKTLPLNVIEDFEEALACSRVEAYKATVAMCRRGLESLSDSLQAKGDYLALKLKDLKDKGLIMESTYHLASGIRQFGNYGAHPQDDLLKGIDRNEVVMVLSAVERLLMEVDKQSREG